MITICESASVTIKAYIYIFFKISFKMNIGELLTDTYQCLFKIDKAGNATDLIFFFCCSFVS